MFSAARRTMKGGPEIVKALTNCHELLVPAEQGRRASRLSKKPNIRFILNNFS